MAEHSLVNMKRSKTKKSEDTSKPFEEPDFPYGLTLYLGDEELSKLGLSETPKIGQEFQVAGLGKVISINESADENSSSKSVTIQLTDLSLTGDKVAKPADKLFGDATSE